MFLIVAKYLIPRGFRGLTIFPFVLVKYREDLDNSILINHEKIHIRQQIELLIIPFFIWYGVAFFVRLIQYREVYQAYSNISFEREAYAEESNASYLKNRSFFNFCKYL